MLIGMMVTVNKFRTTSGNLAVKDVKCSFGKIPEDISAIVLVNADSTTVAQIS